MGKDDFILTYTKKQFWPTKAKEEDVDIIDVAHALSMLCRANGHSTHFYSVGQHSVYCGLEAKNRGLSKRIQLACLLHDASEAYISDITRPVKRLLSEYLVIEEKLQNTIFKKYKLHDLTDEENAMVKEIDDALLNYELKNLLGVENYNDLKLEKEYDLSFILMEDTKKQFLNLYNEIINS